MYSLLVRIHITHFAWSIRLKNKMFFGVIGAFTCLILLSGCAVGSATAAYSVRAGTADDLNSEARTKLVDESLNRSKSYTDEQIAKLRAELGKKP